MADPLPEHEPDRVRLLRDYGVSEGFEAGRAVLLPAFDRARRLPCVLLFAATGRPSVHPGGKPIRASTHAGLSLPLAAVRRFGPPCAVVACPGPLVASAALGVGQRTSVSRLGLTGPTRPAEPPRFEPYELAEGVGQADALTAVASPSPLVGLAPARLLRAIVAALALPSFQSRAAGVAHGEHEDPLSAVGSADVGRRNLDGTRSVTESVQVRPHLAQPPFRARRDVLDDDGAGPELTDDAAELVPETGPCPGEPGSLAGS